MLNTHYLGRVSYDAAYQLQRELWQKRLSGEIPDQLLLLEHDPVITLGRNSKAGHLLVNDKYLQDRGIEVKAADRGGDVTYHGPGQLIGYPIINLSPDRMDVIRYLRDLEEVIIAILSRYEIQGSRKVGLTGVWVDGKKIASLGVKISRWVTYHGFALNVKTDLKAFDYIVPCGLSNVHMTSMALELGHEVDLTEVAKQCEFEFRRMFDVDKPQNVSANIMRRNRPISHLTPTL